MAYIHDFATRLIDAYQQGQGGPSGKFGQMFPKLAPLRSSDDALDELSRVMLDTKPSSQDGDNTHIPVGYTYLGQFIDHDISFDPTSLQETLIDPQALRNFRTPQLDLDSLYGAGPVGQPYLYQRDPGPRRITSDLFLIGKTNTKPGKLDPTLRTELPFDLPRGPEGVALIGDPRNDQHLIIAQMHLAFLRFHNQVVKKPPYHIPPALRFETVRKLVMWHYQWIVLKDFLPWLLDQSQLDRVLTDGPQFYRPAGESFIPVEFSAAAYRFGHSMVREDYDYNRVFTSRRGGKEPATLKALFNFTGFFGDGQSTPIPSDRIIDWRRFFKLDARVEVGFSRKIDPFLAPQLHTLPKVPEKIPMVQSLARRNLQRGQRLSLPSGQNVAQALRLPALKPEEIGRGPDGQVAKKHGFDVETPLWYYILKEAQVRGESQRLGPVGSRIVAEVFVGLLERDSESFLACNPQWKPILPSKQKDHFTMEDLLRFIGDLNPIDDPHNRNV